MSHYDRNYFAGRFAAQEARKGMGPVAGHVRTDGPIQFDLLPMPPTVNEAWHAVPGGTKALTAEHRAFRSTVMGIVHGAQRAGNWMTLLGRLRLTVKLCYCDRRATDIDNRLKPLQDALQAAGAFKNDSQIDELHVVRAVIPGTEECCRVTLEEITDAS